MTRWRPNYYLVFDEESVFHPSSFHRCVRYLFIISWEVDTGEDTVRTDPEVFVTDEPGIQDDVEVDEYLEKVPLLDQETLQEPDPYSEDRSPTPKPQLRPRIVETFFDEDVILVDFYDQSPTTNRSNSPPLDLKNLLQELKELSMESLTFPRMGLPKCFDKDRGSDV